MNHQQRIQRLSCALRLALTAIFLSIPVLSILYWWNLNNLPESLVGQLPVVPRQELSGTTRFFGFLASLIPLAVKMAGLYVLIKLFRLYENAEIFSSHNVACFRNLGRILMLWVISQLIYIPLISLVITYNNPPGERAIAVSLGSTDLTALIVGVILLVVSWVMDEGRKLEDEQRLTV
jgi:cellulose synthase/poly-beta-1,6-N-acetylglucosamine synthase-like glycosyltransferase